MNLFWEQGQMCIRDLVNLIPEPKPHYNTVATLVKFLEENKDNKEFVNNLKEFIKKFKKSELRKLIDSDEFISRSKRTKNINNNLDLVLIKKRRELLEDIFNIKLDNITQRKIEEIFEKLIIRVLEIIS